MKLEREGRGWLGVEGADEEDAGEGTELGGVAGGREERRERAVCDRGDELGIGRVGVVARNLLCVGGVVPVGSKFIINMVDKHISYS